MREEPYVALSSLDIIIQVGIASAMMLLWIEMLVLVLILARLRILSWKWAAVVPLAVVMIFYLSLSPRNVVADYNAFIRKEVK